MIIEGRAGDFDERDCGSAINKMLAIVGWKQHYYENYTDVTHGH